MVFLKPNSAIGRVLHASHGGEPLHYEGELAFVVEGGGFRGVGFGLDLTRRQLQSRLKEKGLPWERAKAFDGAALFSDFVNLPDDLDTLTLSLDVDGEARQTGGLTSSLQQCHSISRLPRGSRCRATPLPWPQPPAPPGHYKARRRAWCPALRCPST